MRKVLLALFVMAAVVIGLGFYLKWFSLTPKGEEDNTNVPIKVPKERSVESQDRTCRSPGWSRRMRATLLRGDPARHPTLAFGPQRQRLRIRPPTSKRYPPHVPADATGSRR
jgi:hypothetical protein